MIVKSSPARPKQIFQVFHQMLRGYERSLARIYAQFMEREKQKTLMLLSSIVKKSEEDELAEDLTNNVFSQGDLSQLEQQTSSFNKQMVADFGKQGLTNVGMQSISFDLTDPKVVKNLKDFDYKLADRLTKTKRKQLGRALSAGFKAGDNYNLMAKRVSKVFKNSVRANRADALRIAATEVPASANFGLFEGYNQSEVVGEKEWLSAFGARDTHAAASGQRVLLNELFTVGGEKARFPGDPRLSADERINCRCTTLPHIKQGIGYCTTQLTKQNGIWTPGFYSVCKAECIPNKIAMPEIEQTMSLSPQPELMPEDFNSAAKQLGSDEAWEASNYTEYAKTEAEYWKKAGIDPKELASRLGKAVDNSTVYMAIKPSTLRSQVLKKGGKFKNSLETGKGTFKTIAQERVPLERKTFGIKASVDDVDAFPKYGFLSDAKEMTAENMVGWGYGDTYVKFKRSKVGGRTSFTIGDSFDGNVRGRIAPSAKMYDAKDTKALRGLSRNNPESPIMGRMKNATSVDDFADVTGNYVEAQVYGKLDVDDIEEIWTSSKKEAKRIRIALKKQKLERIKIRELKYDKRLKDLWEGDYSDDALTWRGSLSPADVDRLGDAYIEKLEVPKTLSSWVKRSKWKAPTDDMQVLLDKYVKNPSAFTSKEQRELTKQFYERVPLGKESGLPKPLYEDYRKTKSGWTDDIFSEEALVRYE